jgi:acylphosphatase
MTDPRRIAFAVTGRVQGVAFRAFTRKQARLLGLTGFVQNEADGRVTGEAQGSPAAVAALLEWLQRGSPLARVHSVDCHERAPLPAEEEFSVRR